MTSVTYNSPMRVTAIMGTTASLALAVWPGALAWADGTALPGTRALGTGGAMRAAATGDAGPMLNPSGISLLRAYTAEGAYQYGSRDSTHDGRASVVDSTSGLNLGGALFYTFHAASPGGISQTGHLVGASLSFPLGDVVFIGVTGKYLHYSTTKGFTVDAGLTIRPVQFLSLAAVGYNLTNPGGSVAPQGVGGGACLSLIPGLLLLVDSVLERVSRDATNPQETRSSVYYVMGGGEYQARTLAVRLGGGRDGLNKNGYLSGGFSFVSGVGALDASLRQDTSGGRKGTFLGVSLRLFVPAP
jgi:hypothetical protein